MRPRIRRPSATIPAQKAVRVKDKPPLWYARTVGGTSVHFTANYWRFHEIDFNERSVLGAIPGTGFADWPISYAELEPYYTKVEWEIGVSGLAGASPFDPPRTKPYPMPPLPVKSSGVLFERGARKLGLHPFPAPMAINSQPYHGRPGLRALRLLPRLRVRGARQGVDADHVIPEAEATGRCEVRADSYVARIETDKRGRATGVAYFDRERREHFQKARAVVVCANGAETPRLLLMSANHALSAGPRQLERLVGKYLMFNYASRARRCLRARAQRIQERAGHAHPARFLRLRSEARLLRRRRPRRAHRAAADASGRCARRCEGPAWGSEYKARLAEFPRTMLVAGHGTSLARRDQQRHASIPS